MNHKLNLLIAEPSDIIREGIRSLIDDDDFNIMAPLCDIPADFPQRLIRLQPDALILNPTLLPAPARTTLASIQQTRPAMAVIALVYQYVEPQLVQSFKTILDIRENGSHVAQLIRECCLNDDDSSDESYELSERESEVLLLVANGLSSKEIADRLNISIHTVNTHRKNITHKTGIKSVAGLAVYAMLHNLV